MMVHSDNESVFEFDDEDSEQDSTLMQTRRAFSEILEILPSEHRETLRPHFISFAGGMITTIGGQIFGSTLINYLPKDFIKEWGGPEWVTQMLAGVANFPIGYALGSAMFKINDIATRSIPPAPFLLGLAAGLVVVNPITKSMPGIVSQQAISAFAIAYQLSNSGTNYEYQVARNRAIEQQVRAFNSTRARIPQDDGTLPGIVNSILPDTISITERASILEKVESLERIPGSDAFITLISRAFKDNKFPSFRYDMADIVMFLYQQTPFVIEQYFAKSIDILDGCGDRVVAGITWLKEEQSKFISGTSKTLPEGLVNSRKEYRLKMMRQLGEIFAVIKRLDGRPGNSNEAVECKTWLYKEVGHDALKMPGMPDSIFFPSLSKMEPSDAEFALEIIRAGEANDKETMHRLIESLVSKANRILSKDEREDRMTFDPNMFPTEREHILAKPQIEKLLYESLSKTQKYKATITTLEKENEREERDTEIPTKEAVEAWKKKQAGVLEELGKLNKDQLTEMPDAGKRPMPPSSQ